jgi:hypothetical protein
VNIKKINWIYLIYPSFLITFLFVALEIILRVYNPLSPRLKGDNIILPINQNYDIHNVKIKDLDTTIYHAKNELGFRGENPPAEFQRQLSLITVGGSTTECRYVSDGKTWEDLLGDGLKKSFDHVWLNNAGLDGHSTFGHLILTDKYLTKLKPKVILFLVGCNDVEIDKIKETDLNNVGKNAETLKQFLNKYSEVYSTFRSLQKSYIAHKKGLSHDTEFNLTTRDTITFTDDSIKKTMRRQEKFIPLYKNRIDSLISLCRRNGIVPIFITQPTLSGDVRDDVTNVDLSKIKLENGMNGKMYWSVLHLYNKANQEICAERGVFCIDLAQQLPKSSRFFYDNIHYNNAGCEKIASILLTELQPYLRHFFPSYIKK